MKKYNVAIVYLRVGYKSEQVCDFWVSIRVTKAVILRLVRS